MIYDVKLTIDYHYAAEVADAQHALRVSPRSTSNQRILSSRIKIDPKPEEIHREVDFFGNRTDTIALWRAHRSLSVEMRARVEVERPAFDISRSASLGAIADLGLRETSMSPGSPAWYLGPSRRIAPLPALTAYIQEIIGPSRDRSAGEAVLKVTERIKTDFTYLPGATDVGTSVEDAFVARVGVCQDFAHVMISGLRGCGIPAGYVSGFLRTDPPPGQPRLEGADAMHAWVTAWLGPEVGWVDFDPTNGILADTAHIVVAIGRDYADVAPVSGVLVTTGRQMTGHSVDVVPLETEDVAAEIA
ncbi:Transglutaminase-like enzyme, putative cysteine protease [Fulvimarina manganoxydans]|uniref:Transglutaminase-like enzyme, putative cysteine protease n=1 Tax=Fulvimarina manganoxydans TaxID=937218 RepID=A0A1W2DRX5_9HYPH|nr:transglutaminase family protein [Fulvimarina manganoxydans]SMD00133.1 Transglutaminase-like enzyme, putative cysteine protease [Fulvimarina manganoxydans]